MLKRLTISFGEICFVRWRLWWALHREHADVVAAFDEILGKTSRVSAQPADGRPEFVAEDSDLHQLE